METKLYHYTKVKNVESIENGTTNEEIIDRGLVALEDLLIILMQLEEGEPVTFKVDWVTTKELIGENEYQDLKERLDRIYSLADDVMSVVDDVKDLADQIQDESIYD